MELALKKEKHRKRKRESGKAREQERGEWEEERRSGGETRKFRKILALFPAGCKSPIEYGGGALEQPKPSPLNGYKKSMIYEGGGAGAVKQVGYLDAKGTL